VPARLLVVTAQANGQRAAHPYGPTHAPLLLDSLTWAAAASPVASRSLATLLAMASDRAAMIAIGRRFIDAFNRRDAQGLVDLADAEIEFRPTSLAGDRTVYRGHDGLRHWVRALNNAMVQHQVRVVDVRALDDDRLVVLSEVLVDGELLSPSAMIATLNEAGKIVAARSYLSDPQLLETLGLAPALQRRPKPRPDSKASHR
jgi:ketosteroid isomerase-like protein